MYNTLLGKGGSFPSFYIKNYFKHSSEFQETMNFLFAHSMVDPLQWAIPFNICIPPGPLRILVSTPSEMTFEDPFQIFYQSAHT